jgi:hypothetical protein
MFAVDDETNEMIAEIITMSTILQKQTKPISRSEALRQSLRRYHSIIKDDFEEMYGKAVSKISSKN